MGPCSPRAGLKAALPSSIPESKLDTDCIKSADCRRSGACCLASEVSANASAAKGSVLVAHELPMGRYHSAQAPCQMGQDHCS